LHEYFGFFGKNMEITRRQEDFIVKIIDLYRELQGPFHYTYVAERLGINPFTAYDMLRLLAKKRDCHVAIPSG